MEEDLNLERFRRRKSGGRRSSSILKTKTPLLDLDPNQPIPDAVIPRKKARISTSRRVSFAETYQVKEFPRDSPHRWMPDPEADDDSSPELENLPSVPLHKSRSEIQGLDKLLTGPIQNSPSDQDEFEEKPLPDENSPLTLTGPNHTILQDENMDMTECLDQDVMMANSDKPISDDFGDNFGTNFGTTKLNGKSFLSSLKSSTTDSFADKIFLPEKNFSKEDDKNYYHLDKESDFMTIVNSSMNRYSLTNGSQSVIAGVSNTSVTTSVSVISSVSGRKPLTSIDKSLTFKPVVVEETQTVNLAENLPGTVDGMSFLRQLNKTTSDSVFSSTDRVEDQTVFDCNDMEETEVLTKCFHDDEDLLKPSNVKIPSFLSSFKEFTKDDNQTMIFGKDDDMDQTEVFGNKIDIVGNLQWQSAEKKRSPGFSIVRPNNHLQDLKGNTKTELLSNASKINKSIRRISGMIGGVDEKTQVFENDNEMEQTEMLTGKVSVHPGLNSNETKFFRDDLMEETGVLTGVNLIQNSKLLEKNKTILYKDNDMEETNVLGEYMGLLKSSKLLDTTSKVNKTLMFNDGSEMEQTMAFTNKIELPVLSKTLIDKGEDEDQNRFVDRMSQNTELPSLAKKMRLGGEIVNNKTLLFTDGIGMEETVAITGKIDLPVEDLKDKTTIFQEGNPMEETCVQTSTTKNRTLVFNDNNDMEETCALNRNSVSYVQESKTTICKEKNETKETCTHSAGEENMSYTKENKTTLFKENDELEETCRYTSKIEYVSCRRKQSVNKTTLFETGDELEQTQALTGKIEIPPGSDVRKNCRNLQTQLQKIYDVERVEIKTQNKTLQLNDEMEQTKAFTGNLELGKGAPQNKTLQLNDEMEQTKAFTGKLELGKCAPQNKTLQLNDEMEQTKAFTGKLELGKGAPQNKTLQLNDEMEQTKAFTGKLELGKGAPQNKTIQLNDEMEQTKAFTGKLELGKGAPQNKTLQLNDEMEQTNAFTGKLELGSDEAQKTEVQLNDEMLQTNAMPEKLNLDNEMLKNTKVDNTEEEIEQTKALTEKLDLWNKDMNDENLFNENDLVKLRYKKNRALIQRIHKHHQDEIDIANDSLDETAEKSGKPNTTSEIAIDLEKQYLELQINKSYSTEDSQSGWKGMLAKLRQDRIGSEDYTDFLDISMTTKMGYDKIDNQTETAVKYLQDTKNEENEKKIENQTETAGNYMQDAKNEENKDEDNISRLKMDSQTLSGMMERIEKNPRRSFGMSTRTPMGKAFCTNREVVSELKPQIKGSTVKLSAHAATEHTISPENDHHQGSLCSKELFSSENQSEQENVESPEFSKLESSMNVTVRNRSRSQGSFREEDTLHHLELEDGSVVGGISDEHLPADMLTNSTVTSVHSDNTVSSQCPEFNMTTSSGAQSIIESQMDDLLKQSMMEETDGPMSVPVFCRRIQVTPFWLKEGKMFDCRHSIATLQRVDKETINGKLEAVNIHEPFCDVYSKIIEEGQISIEECKQKTEELSDEIKDHQPEIFDVVVNGSQELRNQTRENLKVLAKCCAKEGKRQWKSMKIKCHEELNQRLQERRDILNDQVNQVVQASDVIQEHISSLSNATCEIDNLIIELENKPLPSDEDVEFWKLSQQDLQQRQEKLDQVSDTLSELEREKVELEREKSRIVQEEEELNADKTSEISCIQTEIQELEEKLDTLESLIEWRLEDYDDDYISFLFFDDSMKLSLSRQHDPNNGQVKIASANVQSLLDGDAKPAEKLIHSIVLKRIEDLSLSESYKYISQLPELLHNLSQLVHSAKSFRRQIITLSLKYLVTVYEDFIKVEKWSEKTLRKVNINFTCSFEDSFLQVVPTVSVKMGDIRPEEILEQLNNESKGQDYLLRLCDSVNLDIISNVKKNS